MTSTDGHEARRLRTRQQVLDAAETLFAEKGYANTSIADIADAANIGRRTVYLHFADKDAILEEMAQLHVEEIVASVKASGATSFQDKLRIAFREIFVWMQSNEPLCRIIVSGDNELNERMNDNMRQAFLTEMNQYAKMRPDSNLNMPFLATAVSGIVNEMMRVWVTQSPDVDVDTAVEMIMTLLYTRLGDHLEE